MGALLLLFIVLVGGGWLAGKLLGSFLFPNKTPDKFTFVDNSVHYHEHKSISIIDDATKQKIFELKESKEVTK